MADVFAEIDEVMRQERMAKFWNDYSGYIITFVLGVILLTAAFSGYDYWNKNVQQTQTTQILELQAEGDYPLNMVEADLSDLRGSLRAVAYLSAAKTLVERGNEDEALILYDRVASDEAIDAEFSQLGALMAVRLKMDQEGADADALLKMMQDVYSDEDSLWGYYARLEAALVLAHMKENYAAARGELNAIRDSLDVPESLRQKAEALDHVYAMKQDKQQDKE